MVDHGEPSRGRKRLNRTRLLGSPFLLSRRCRRVRRRRLGRLGLVRCRRARRRRLGFWQRFAMIGHGSVSFHCTSSAPGSFVTKASPLGGRPSHLIWTYPGFRGEKSATAYGI